MKTTEQLVRKCFCKIICDAGDSDYYYNCGTTESKVCGFEWNKIARVARRFVRMEQKQKTDIEFEKQLPYFLKGNKQNQHGAAKAR